MIYQPVSNVSNKYYHYLENAEKDFPDSKIAVFREESVENPEFVDKIRTVIKIVQEPCPTNPFEDWDCCYPLMRYSGRYETDDYSGGDIDSYLGSYLSISEIEKNMDRLLTMMGETRSDFTLNYPLGEEGYSEEERVDRLADMLMDFIGDSIENKVLFCEEFDIKHYSSTSTGYSQGCWANVFTCWTPEFGELCGVAYEEVTIEALKSNFELFGQWAWGDVYFYLVEDEEGNVLDSCGGFYGTDFLENGIMEYIMTEIEDKTEEEVREILTNIKTTY